MIPVRGNYAGKSHYLCQDFNDIHLFQDKVFENLYQTILECCDIYTKKIFSKNRKQSIIEQSKKSKDQKCVYLIDRDWSDAL